MTSDSFSDDETLVMYTTVTLFAKDHVTVSDNVIPKKLVASCSCAETRVIRE